MGFWTGFAVGIVTVLIGLPLFSKPIMKLAAKRQLNVLLGSVKGMEGKFEDMLKPVEKEEKDGEQQEDSGSRQPGD